MLNLEQRIQLLGLVQNYMLGEDAQWRSAQANATVSNPWFIPPFVKNAVQNIGLQFLDPGELKTWAESYRFGDDGAFVADVGITMAGNIPLAGFHDFLCVFISGHKQTIRRSSKDQILLKHIVDKMTAWNKEMAEHVRFADMLKECDAYIATGSGNTAKYFEYYFRNYPHIIRKNRTSVAILTGQEQTDELERLADDVYLYFGLGCRNITKIFVPSGFDFLPMLEVFKAKYDWVIENHKYKHNYDYQLALQIMNRKFYMTNGSIILSENESPFSPVSQLNFQYYTSLNEIYPGLNPDDIQCIAGTDNVTLGTTQSPTLTDYPDGIDTMNFLRNISIADA